MDQEQEQGEWQSVEPFFIDDGQLDGISPQDAFVLGVEWQMVYAELDTGRAFDRPIHANNRERMMRLCLRNRRQYEIAKPEGGWCHLTVSEVI